MELQKRITKDPQILSGKPCVKGTRISVAFVLYLLAGEADAAGIVKRYPQLTIDDIRACCLYASENLPGGDTPWQFEGSFLDSDEWTLVEGNETPSLQQIFRNG